MAAAPVRPWRAPESRAEDNVSFLHAKPAKRENSGEVQSMQSWRPQSVLNKRNQAAAQSAIAKMNEALRGDGSKIEGRRTASGINAVASRLSVLLLAGPLIKPSIKGMIAAEAINEVKRKSAFRSILKTAERAASKAEQAIPAVSARRTAAKGGRFVFASITALTKPPRYIWPSPPRL